MSGQRIEEVRLPSLAKTREEATGVPKRKPMPPSEGAGGHSEEGLSEKKSETLAPKTKRKPKREPVDDTEGRRRRKPKPIVEVNSTFTDLRRLLQEMRPSTLQVLKTPYYRNCKAARNMRKGVRQIRDFCKQVRLETVMLAKKKQGEEVPKKKKKPEATTPPSDTGEDMTRKRRKPATPPHDSGEEMSRKKKKQPEVAASPVEEEEDDHPRKRKKPEVASPPQEEVMDDESGGKSDGAASPPDVAVDDESMREPEVSTPPIDLIADDDA